MTWSRSSVQREGNGGAVTSPEGGKVALLAKAAYTAAAGDTSPPKLASFAGLGLDGFKANLEDFGLSVDAASIKAVVDGAEAAVTTSKDGSITTVSYAFASLPAPLSTHTVALSYSDLAGNSHSVDLSFSITVDYQVLPVSIASTSVDKSSAGFIANITQISTLQLERANNIHGNSIAGAEKQLAGLYLNPNEVDDDDNPVPYLNEADPDADEGWSIAPVEVDGVINWNQDEGAAIGNFGEDQAIPQIPGWGDSADGIVAEMLGYLELSKGLHTLGVNSDDGFKVSFGPNPKDQMGIVAGEFNGGRGAADTLFNIVAEADGLYPVRLLWYEGSDPANVEFFSMDDKGKKILINDPANANAIKAYRTADTAPYISRITPAAGDLSKTIEIDFVNADLSVVKSSVKMKLNGEDATISTKSTDDGISVVYDHGDFLPAGAHTVELTYTESGGVTRVRNYSFTIPFPFDETKTRIALPLAEPPTIDGIIDINGGESWAWAGGAAGTSWRVEPDENLADGIRGGSIGDNGVDPVDKQDLSYLIFAGYDADNLYVAVRVQDDILSEDSVEAGSKNGNTWHDDSVEIFVDGDNSNFPDRSGNNPNVIDTGGQFVITVNNAYRENEAGNPGYGEGEAWFALTSVTDTGYDAEFRISLDTIGNPKPGDVIGFTVGVNDDDDGGPAERQVLWVGMPHTEITYGNLLLGGKTYTAPKKAAPKIDGVIHAAEYAGAERTYVNPHNGIYDITVGDDSWDSSDHSFFAWVTHDYEAVYVAVDVTDPNVVTDSAGAGTEDGNTWQDDSVEIFFDTDDSNDAGRGSNGFEGQYVLTANGAWRDKEANNPKFGKSGDWFAATKRTGKGYQVEFKIKKSALSNPADGASLGFNIAINDDDGKNGSRKAQLNWSGRPHSEFTYGRLILEEGEGGGPPPAISAKLNADGTVTVTFDGKLQTAPTVNGPWQDVDAESPLILQPDQPATFGRAVSE